MVKHVSEFAATRVENDWGGPGYVTTTRFATQEEMFGKTRLFGKTVLTPGCGIGYHVHKGELEFYYIIKGTAKYDDNGTECILKAGDVTFTADGEGHAITNIGEDDLEFIAFIPVR